MRVIQSALDVVDRSIGHPAAFKNLQPLLSRLFPRLAFNQVIDLVPVRHTSAVSRKSRVALPFWMSESLAEGAKQLVISRADEDIPVARPITSVGHDRR